MLLKRVSSTSSAMRKAICILICSATIVLFGSWKPSDEVCRTTASICRADSPPKATSQLQHTEDLLTDALVGCVQHFAAVTGTRIARRTATCWQTEDTDTAVALRARVCSFCQPQKLSRDILFHLYCSSDETVYISKSNLFYLFLSLRRIFNRYYYPHRQRSRAAWI